MTKFVCGTCGDSRFVGGRQITIDDLADGTKKRGWAEGLEASSEILCVRCKTTYRWNATTSQFERLT